MPTNAAPTGTVTWPNYSPVNVKKAASSKSGSELGKDQFLSILIKQLQYQDPLQPMEDKEFIAQMAQFTSLEQLMNISSQLTEMRQSLGTASSLIGKKVSWLEASSDKTGSPEMKSGIVDSILIRDGRQFAKVGKDEIPLDFLVKIENAEPAEEAPGTGSGDTPGTESGQNGESGESGGAAS